MKRYYMLPEVVLRAVVIAGTVVALAAMLVLGIRALSHFDPSWDSLAYHLPFAAGRAGIHISFEMDDYLVDLYNGAPPLPELLQGLVWRVTKSVSATGLASFLAFAAFVGWCNRLLRTPLWLVVLIPLTAPLIIIHVTATYADLITNAFFAIAAATAIYMWLFPGGATKLHLVGGLLALAAAYWSKYTVVPFASILFVLYVPIALRAGEVNGWSRRWVAAVIGFALLIAAVPYLKNLLEFGNPFWPVKAPFIGSLFPYQTAVDQTSRPANLANATSIEAFVRSLLEVGSPPDYERRARWTIDMGGNVGNSFRMGGFWYLGVVVYLGTMLALLWTLAGRRGRVVALAAVVALLLVALVPQANELRYWMFIPMVWAAVIGMLYHKLADKSRMVASLFGIVVIVMFGYMVTENRHYYDTKGYSLRDAARETGAQGWWAQMEADRTYCAVGMNQLPLLLTGPTLNRFEVVARSGPETCPPDSLLLTPEGISELPPKPTS